MDYEKIGRLIKSQRKALGLTQLQLANKINISDKAVSKWERGLGCPDISLLNELSDLFGINIEEILNGELPENDEKGGNMKNICYYVCPDCNNIICGNTNTKISCCGKILSPLKAEKFDDMHCLDYETVENELFITSKHPAIKEHYISFIALQNTDTLIVKKLYPEWDVSLRLPKMHGKLLFYCTKHGLFFKNI